MRDLARCVASFTWAMSLFGFRQMANLMSPRRMLDAPFRLVGMRPSPNGTGSAPPSGVLSQMGNLAFELLQLGVSTVYTVTGTAWRQQQGAPGWGRVEPPQPPNPPRP